MDNAVKEPLPLPFSTNPFMASYRPSDGEVLKSFVFRQTSRLPSPSKSSTTIPLTQESCAACGKASIENFPFPLFLIKEFLNHVAEYFTTPFICSGVKSWSIVALENSL